MILLVLSEKKRWQNGTFDGPTTGYNVRLGTGGQLIQAISKVEQLLESSGLPVKRRTAGQYCYLLIRGNSQYTDTT